MNIIRTLIISLMVAVCLPAMAADGASMAASAQKEYEAGNYKDAARIYQEMEKTQGTSPELYYNLGNALYRDADLGGAVLAYSRGLRLSPSDKDIRRNLIFVQGKVEDRNTAQLKGKPGNVLPQSPGFISGIWTSITSGVSAGVWSVWAIAAFMLTLAAIAAYAFCHAIMLRKVGFFTAVVALPLCVLFNVFAFGASSAASNHDTAVVTAYTVQPASDPSAKAAPVCAPITAGTIVTIEENETIADGTEWVRIYLNPEVHGWVPKNDVTAI